MRLQPVQRPACCLQANQSAWPELPREGVPAQPQGSLKDVVGTDRVIAKRIWGLGPYAPARLSQMPARAKRLGAWDAEAYVCI